ncbi:MAG: flagellar export protein FliJ [Candidatus Latescibacterota bacterium]|nr:MAG: flagellar export protein FliJ [Candidatus Latescibacterota bacterium]
MRAFRFKLERVLQVRRLQEDLQREAFWKAQRDLDDAKEYLRALQEEFVKYKELLRSRRSGEAEAHEVLSYERYLDYLHTAIERQRQVVDRLRAQLEEHRRALHEAVRKRQVLERLKERQEDAYRRYKNKVFQNFLDEVGSRTDLRREDICGM